MLNKIPTPLFKEILNGKASLFLGAGASLEARFPDSQKLGEYLINEADPSYSSILSGQSLDTIVDYFYDEESYGTQWVRNKVITFFENLHRNVERPPSLAHDLMTKIKWRTIFTTNYDRLIEISYDSSKECAQRSLPIYQPDAQIMKHDSSVVRIIKLNGSVDEASRNSNHQLVFTFQEQQENRIKNKKFYELLQEEAVNGPIIFLGFRFIHPGSRQIGTSPEYAIFKDLLREMGPAARSHYCILPFNTSDQTSQLFIKKLKANKIILLNAKFGEFMEALVEQMQNPVSSTSEKKSIFISIADSEISIDEHDYSKDRRHFEIIGSHLEELPFPSVSESLNGRYNWKSFFEKHLIERSCKKDLLSFLKNSCENLPALTSIVAPAGWGKTFLLRDVAVDLYKQGKPIIWLNPHSTTEYQDNKHGSIIINNWDSIRIDRIVGMINSKIDEASLKKDDYSPIIICDDCPERVDEVLNLFNYLKNNKRYFSLIISFRDNEFDSIISEYPVLSKGTSFKPEKLYDSKEEVGALVDFCAKNKVSTIEDEFSKEIVVNRILADEADKSLILALQIIFDKKHRPFSEIMHEIWENIEDENAKKLVIRVSSLHRFGSSYFPRLYPLIQTFPQETHYDAIKSYEECLEKNILFESYSNDEPCVSTLHSLIADQLTKVSGKNLAEIDDELINLIRKMTTNQNDLETIRILLKRINDYDVNLSNESKIKEIFEVAAEATEEDWVICHQFCKYLLKRNEFELASYYIDRALIRNPNHSTLHHTKGNVLRRWGADLKSQGRNKEAVLKLDEARTCFSRSRLGSNPNEYGYVTHLDMLLHELNETENEVERLNLLAEGAQIYKEGIRAVPNDKYNLLLEPRFKRFDLDGKSTEKLCSCIKEAIFEEGISVYATAFLAEETYKLGKYNESLEIIKRQKDFFKKGLLLWVKEAEIHALEGNFSEALKAIDSARRRVNQSEDKEITWRLFYWDLIISTVTEQFREARTAARKLAEGDFYSKRHLPRGYVWKPETRNIPVAERSFKDHAKIWEGRIQDLRTEGQYGRIELSNYVGETFYIKFNPRYFSRKDLRRGDYIRFVMAFHPDGIHAESLDPKPFRKTINDVYLP